MRLVIIDDDPFVCGSLRTILDAQGDIEVVAVGHDGNEAQELYRLHMPDILLTDIQMPECNGLEAAAAILGQWPDARIVLLTTFSDDEYIISALRMGAKGYLIKQDVTTIAPALRLVMSGQSVLGNEVLGRMDHLMRDKASEAEGSMEPGSGDVVSSSLAPGSGATDPKESEATGMGKLAILTKREYEITELVAEGLNNQQISATLFISEGTVRNLISAILQKLDLENRTQLAVLYYRKGQS